MITKTIAVCQMATVLGRTMTAIRECIARDKFPFAQCWPEEKINEAFKEAHIV